MGNFSQDLEKLSRLARDAAELAVRVATLTADNAGLVERLRQRDAQDRMRVQLADRDRQLALLRKIESRYQAAYAGLRQIFERVTGDQWVSDGLSDTEEQKLVSAILAALSDPEAKESAPEAGADESPAPNLDEVLRVASEFMDGFFRKL